MEIQNEIFITKSYLKELTYNVIGAAIEVHKELGPGLLESVYHQCMKRELDLRGMKYFSELTIPVHYKGVDIITGLRFDLLVENCLVVELKAVEVIPPIHEARLMTYMKLTSCPQGLMINFNCLNIFKEGQKTFVNELFRNLPD